MCDLVVKTNGTVIWSNLLHIGKMFGIWPRQWLKVSKSVRCMRIVHIEWPITKTSDKHTFHGYKDGQSPRQVIKRYVILISYRCDIGMVIGHLCGSRHCLVKWTARAIWEQEELVGGLEHFFPYIYIYIGNNHPNWLSYFSDQPPTRE